MLARRNPFMNPTLQAYANWSVSRYNCWASRSAFRSTARFSVRGKFEPRRREWQSTIFDHAAAIHDNRTLASCERTCSATRWT